MRFGFLLISFMFSIRESQLQRGSGEYVGLSILVLKVMKRMKMMIIERIIFQVLMPKEK